MLPPPPGNLKRKTLVDRAGEPARAAPAPPSSRPINAAVKATSITGLSRQASFSSSASSRPSSVSSMRNVSNSSFSSSVGGGRPPSSQSYRPHTALSSHNTQKHTPLYGRPASFFDPHADSGQVVQTNGQRSSMTPFSSSIKKHSSMQDIASHTSFHSQGDTISNWSSSTTQHSMHLRRAQSYRDLSLSTALSKLSLNQHDCDAIPEENVDVVSTPSHLPKRKTSKFSLVQDKPSPLKSPKKTPKPSFLRIDSNVQAIAWDTESRLENVENMYSELEKTFQKTVKSTTTESNSLKETINLYKARSRYIIPRERTARLT